MVTPPNSYRIAAYLRAAKSLAVDAVVASPGRHALVGALSSGLHVDLNDPRAMHTLLEASAARPFQGVIATDDAAVEFASRVAQQLALPHNPPAAAELSRRKDLARACLWRAGVAVPAHRVVRLDEPLEPQLDGLKYPQVVKPVSLSASRGVMRVDNREACLGAIGRVRKLLEGERQLVAEERGQLLIETFIPGPEVAVEGLLHAGEFQLLAMFDKPDPMHGPCFEETYYISPSRHDPDIQRAVVRTVQDACRAYGLREGPVHAELRLHEAGIQVMEVASRTIGGECARLLTYGVGQDLETMVIRKALGEAVRVEAQSDAMGVLMLPTPSAGVLRRVEGLQAAQKVRWIEEVMISVREGYELVPLPEGGSYLGFVFARGPSPDQVEAALRAAHAKLNIVVAPVFKMQDRRS